MREAVIRFMTAADGPEVMAAVEAFPELLTEQGERAAAGTAANFRGQIEAEKADHMDEKVELLRRARVVGMEQALADKFIEPFHAAVDAADAGLTGFLKTGNGELLDEAVSVWRAIVAHEYLTFHEVAYQHWALQRAATAIMAQYRRTGQPALLDEAVTLLERATGLDGVERQRRLMGLYDLGSALMLRHGARGNLDDRDRAVAVLRSAAALARPGSPVHHEVMEKLRVAEAAGPGRGSAP